MCHFQKVIYKKKFESRTDELTELCSGIVSFISSKRPKNADFLSIIERFCIPHGRQIANQIPCRVIHMSGTHL